MLLHCLWPDEVQFGLVASTTSQLHIMPIAVNVGALLNVWPIMGGNGGEEKKIQHLTASPCLASMLQPRLWPDEVQFGLVASTISQPHIIVGAVNVGALLDVWPIMGGYGGI